MKPALRRILRDERTLQFGVHPRQAVMLTDLTPPIRQWIESLDGTSDLTQAIRKATQAGLDETSARTLLAELTAQGILEDAAQPPTALHDLPLSERDRLRPDLDALDLSRDTPAGGLATLSRRRASRVRVYGAGRVGAQIINLLTASGVGSIRVIDPAPTRPADLVPGGLTWSELGLPREDAAVAAAARLASPRETPPQEPRSPATAPRPTTSHPARISPPRRPGPRGQAPSTAAVPQPPTTPAVPQAPTTTAIPQASSTAAVSQASSTAAVSQGPSTAAVSQGPSTDTVSDGCPTPESSRSAASPYVLVKAGGPYLSDRSERPDLVVLAPVGPLDGILVTELTALGIPHMLVSAFEGHGSVGPLVHPGTSACLHCLDLTRRDRDPGWPMVTARLGGFPAGEIACDTTLATLVAAEATRHALAYLDGRPSIVTNGTVDILPDWQRKRRTWAIHPQCRCIRNNPDSLRMVRATTCD